jgi:hypothetical protein
MRKDRDEETERALRIYSKSGTSEYVPRSKGEDDYVVARPLKVPKCAACGKTEPEPFECEFCHEYYCEEHLPPEKHDCPGYRERGREREESATREEDAAMKRAIVAKMENIIGRLPARYMLIDTASHEELEEFLRALEAMEDVLTGIASREGMER